MKTGLDPSPSDEPVYQENEVDHMEKTSSTDIRKMLRDKIYAYANGRGYTVNESNVENIIDPHSFNTLTYKENAG